ncbi:Defensin-like protein 222 [Arabidopsis thaliana]|uniref:Uncharacterized protein n=2 Tax=Arabidopsis TaxID=3701 RepID=A0A178UC36_ARATH|nr:hypothetical protein ISN45_At05g045930 [Arabidopsis thaliana x Arabidopsis arenosa]OAO91235.1 hypothetical protein AXX17_AT5G49320 [Arabidopsis thaliana]
MRTIVLFSTLMILVLSCMSTATVKSYSEEKTHSFDLTANPPIDLNIVDELPRDEHLGVSHADNVIGFCQECAHHCLQRKRVLGECRWFTCHCSRITIGVGL